MDPKTSRRIFELARDQQNELEEPEDDEDEEFENQTAFTLPRSQNLDEDDDDLADFNGSDVEEEVEEIVSILSPCAQPAHKALGRK